LYRDKHEKKKEGLHIGGRQGKTPGNIKLRKMGGGGERQVERGGGGPLIWGKGRYVKVVGGY